MAAFLGSGGRKSKTNMEKLKIAIQKSGRLNECSMRLLKECGLHLSNEEGQLGYWEEVVPSYTLFHPENKTFTDIWSEYSADFETFYQTVVSDMAQYRNVTGVIKARPGQPANYCPVSSLPWLSFTAFAQDTYSENKLLFPLIKFGKYFEANGRIQIPVSVFVSHAVADGYHTCKLMNDMQEIAEQCF